MEFEVGDEVYLSEIGVYDTVYEIHAGYWGTHYLLENYDGAFDSRYLT